METTPVRRRGIKRDYSEDVPLEEESALSPETPVSKVICYSDEGESPGLISELFRGETFSPPIVTWDTVRPKASPGTAAAARRINREIKQHVKARKERSRVLKFQEEQTTASLFIQSSLQEQSVEKYKQNVAEIYSRIKNIFAASPKNVRIHRDVDEKEDNIVEEAHNPMNKCGDLLQSTKSPKKSSDKSVLNTDIYFSDKPKENFGDFECDITKSTSTCKSGLMTTGPPSVETSSLPSGNSENKSLEEFFSVGDDELFMKLNF